MAPFLAALASVTSARMVSKWKLGAGACPKRLLFSRLSRVASGTAGAVS